MLGLKEQGQAGEEKKMTICIIPATADDMRLVDGEPMLLRAIKRARACKDLDGVVVATTAKKTEDMLAKKCREWRVPYYRGGNTVLDRVYAAAIMYCAGTVALIQPKSDAKPENIEWAVRRIKEAESDYARSGNAEAFDLDSLIRAWVEARGAERDTANLYILTRRDEFQVEEGNDQ